MRAICERAEKGKKILCFARKQHDHLQNADEKCNIESYSNIQRSEEAEIEKLEEEEQKEVRKIEK
jgi:hypothetical protein